MTLPYGQSHFSSAFITDQITSDPLMNPQRPSIEQVPSSASLLSPFSLLQGSDNYFFRELRARSRPKLSERSSDSLSGRTPTPKLGRSSIGRPFTGTSNNNVDPFVKRDSVTNEVVAEEIPGFSPSNTVSSASTPVAAPAVGDPPRPAKPGFEWVWYPDPYGYWAERPEIPRSAAASITKNWPLWKKISFTRKTSTSSNEKIPWNADLEQLHIERTFSYSGSKPNSERKSSLKLFSRKSDAALLDALPTPAQESLQQKFVKGFQFLSTSPKIESPTKEIAGFFKYKLGKRKKVISCRSYQNPESEELTSRIASPKVIAGIRLRVQCIIANQHSPQRSCRVLRIRRTT